MSANDQRYREIYAAVSHGALEDRPKVADDMMFLCEYIRTLLARTHDASADELREPNVLGHIAAYTTTVYDALMLRGRAWLAPDAGEATTEAFHAVATRQGCTVERRPDGATLATDPKFLAGKAVKS